jgi:peroxisomal 3,2-trans-enoyl-CoA isomerase
MSCHCLFQTMRLSKVLIRNTERDTLHSVNATECKQLVERWQSQECINAIMNFFSKKSNL